MFMTHATFATFYDKIQDTCGFLFDPTKLKKNLQLRKNLGFNTCIVSACILGGHFINTTNNHTSITIVASTK